MDDVGHSAHPYEHMLPISYADLVDGGFASAAYASERDAIDLMHEADFDISEFFDLENAALNPDDAQLYASDPHSISRTPGLTLRSAGSKSPVQLPLETYEQVAQNAVLNAYTINKYPKPAQPVTTADFPLNWPIEHYAIHMEPRRNVVHTATPPDHTNKNTSGRRKMAIEEDTLGSFCFDSGKGSHPIKRKKCSDEARDSARRVRAQGACLRCYVQKKKCSEGRPCDECQAVFNRAHGSKMLRWTACISSKLSDLNIFRLGASLPAYRITDPANQSSDLQNIDASTASFLYEGELQLMSSSGLLSEFDSIYDEVLQHTYGRRAAEVHPFVLEQQTPLHMLIRFNVILLGIPVVGHRILGYVRFLQLLRAACAIVSFECLQKAFERNMLATSTLNRQQALIIQAALLLDQVVEMGADAPTFATCFAQGNHYQDMHQHLVQYISHYLQQLISGVFGKGCSLIKCLRNVKSGGFLSEKFWDNLAGLMPTIPLGKPQKIRGFADKGSKACSDEMNLEALYQKLYL